MSVQASHDSWRSRVSKVGRKYGLISSMILIRYVDVSNEVVRDTHNFQSA